jgi:hypothetical protein
MVDYDYKDKSINRDISFGRWFSIIVCSTIIICGIIYNFWS